MDTEESELVNTGWTLLIALILVAGCKRENEVPPAESVETPVSSERVGFAPEAVTLAPGVHLLGKVVPGNAYAIETGEGLVLIDCGIRDDASFVIRQLEELGLDVDDLQAIFITHAHVDHFQGAAYLRERTGAKVHAGAGDAGVIRAGTDRDAMFSKYSMTGLRLHPTPVDVTLQGDERISMGGVEIQAMATPGHSPGSMCFLVTRDATRMLFTGDAISSLTGEFGTYIARLSPRFRGNAESYSESLKRLAQLPAPDLVFPGHTEEDPLGQSPVMNARLWSELTARGLDECRQILGRFAADGRDFLGEEPFRIHGPLLFLGRFRDQGMFALHTDKEFHLFDAPGGRGLMEFLTSSLDQLGLELPDRRWVLFTNLDSSTTANLKGLSDSLGFRPLVGTRGKAVFQQRFPGTDVMTLDAVAQPGDEFRIIAHELDGLGLHPTVYAFAVDGKLAVVTGRMVVEPMEASVNRLFKDLMREGSVSGYQGSLRELEGLSPDIWLPTIIVNDQNANIYDDQWREVLTTLSRLVRQVSP